MASEVNTRSLSVEDFSLRFGRYNRNVLTFAFRLRRFFRHPVAAAGLHQTANQGPSRPALCQGRMTAGRSARRLRNSHVPHAGLSKRGAHAPKGGPSSVPARRAGSLGPSRRLPIHRVVSAEPRRGLIQATRSGLRALGCIAGSTSQTFGCLQHPRLRSSLACLSSASSSPARSAKLDHGSCMMYFSCSELPARGPACLACAGRSQGTSRPRR
jgi:hypothetical protein